MYWPFGPIQGCACHITDLLDVDTGNLLIQPIKHKANKVENPMN